MFFYFWVGHLWQSMLLKESMTLLTWALTDVCVLAGVGWDARSKDRSADADSAVGMCAPISREDVRSGAPRRWLNNCWCSQLKRKVWNLRGIFWRDFAQRLCVSQNQTMTLHRLLIMTWVWCDFCLISATPWPSSPHPDRSDRSSYWGGGLQRSGLSWRPSAWAAQTLRLRLLSVPGFRTAVCTLELLQVQNW